MSDLQLALLALGAALVVAVVGYNAFQERRARRRAESAFRSAHPDALLDPALQRREPVMGSLPEEPAPGTEAQRPATPPPEAVPPDWRPPEAPDRLPEARASEIPPVEEPKPATRTSPSAVISHAIDTIAIILADEPVGREQLQQLTEALADLPTPVRLEGLVDEQWVPVEESPRAGWRELRVGLQLASRAGAVSEERIAAFVEAVAGFATAVNAVSQRENPAAAAARARELDRFCAEVDVEVALNVVGRSGAAIALARVSTLALEHGFAQLASGAFERRGADRSVTMTLRLHDGESRRDALTTTGLTFALDIPHVADPVAVLVDMAETARSFAQALGGELVDDERRPLGAPGIAAIGQSLEKVVRRMEAQGIAPGGALARRLFS